ncbi:Uncharacterized protein FWK35_00024868 [Aphis craccivora]|uniref:Uncharacterized protein n=1 Tax=Aphis craccivora TaxID=307492 RepID=A0A6G0YRN1_APHCR|nr:Uncharacterized protein FWK35_00024868 [Aphis craccivora]
MEQFVYSQVSHISLIIMLKIIWFGNNQQSNRYITKDRVFILNSMITKFMENLHLLATDSRCKSEYPWCIIEVKSKHLPTVFKKIEKKNDRKQEFLRKTSFRPN